MTHKRKSAQFKLSLAAIRNIHTSVIAVIYFAIMFAVSFYLRNHEPGFTFMY